MLNYLLNLELIVLIILSFYDKNNNVFFKGSESNEWVNLDDISVNLINATIYTEDKNFYKHFGFDFLRIVKALYYNIKSKKLNKGLLLLLNNMLKIYF